MSLPSSHVSFQVAFPKEHSPSSPAGAELAAELTTHLEAQGVDVLNRSKTDYSHTFSLRIGGRMFDAGLGLVDDGVREWLFFFEPGGSVFWRLFVSLSSTQQLSLGNAVQAALASIPGVRNIRWYRNASVWNHGGEREFSPAPEA